MVLIAATAGCVGSDLTPGSTVSDPQLGPVVVALLDTGIDPYHAAFAGGPDVARLGDVWNAKVHRLSSTGTWEERHGVDATFWESSLRKSLYAFEGTRLLAISFYPPAPYGIVEGVNGGYGHGTGTAGAVAKAAPDAVILMVQVNADDCLDRPECYVNPSVSEALDWTAAQHWIDIVSVSINQHADAPPLPTHDDARRYRRALETAEASGKIVLNSAGNVAGFAWTSALSGPPEVIAAGGLEYGPRGESAVAARGADVVSNFTSWVARAGTLDQYFWGQGTSYAAPEVAGTLAAALQEVRAARPDLAADKVATARALREAMNLAATPVSATEWDPTNPTANETLWQLTGPSLPVLVPPAQTGWGYVHAGLAAEIARRVIEDDYSLPAGKEATRAWMDAVMAARRAYWDGQ